jgi:hypothetical protein
LLLQISIFGIPNRWPLALALGLTCETSPCLASGDTWETNPGGGRKWHEKNVVKRVLEKVG